MNRLEKILYVFNQYDQIAEIASGYIKNYAERKAAFEWLALVREDRDKLVKELIEHGCRRKS